jgi:7-cyano-7-deazaguanine synthase
LISCVCEASNKGFFSPMPTAIVLLSGGLDSATCLAIARSQGFALHALTFDYGQRHRHELVAAAALAQRFGAPCTTVKLDLRAIGGSALTSETPVPKHDNVSDLGSEIPVTYVPARNLTFLSLAVGLCEAVNAADIFIGVNAVDYSGYPDCRPQFIESFAATARLATKAGSEGKGFAIHTPLIAMTKAQIIQTGTALGVDYALTHSCYDPVQAQGSPLPLACGHCDSCLLRAKGFADAGVKDPTKHASL